MSKWKVSASDKFASLLKQTVGIFLSFRTFARSASGNIAVLMAVCLMALLLVVGTAVDFTRLTNFKSEAQARADSAVLAAAKAIREEAYTLSFEERKDRAKNVAEKMLEDFLKSPEYLAGDASVAFSNADTEMKVELRMKAIPVFAHLFGLEALDFKVDSYANIEKPILPDIDIVLISDATWSMDNLLSMIQDNMNNFSHDLQIKLKAREIKVGKIRVGFIFFRDYMIDNHREWTSPEMQLLSGLSHTGPMYSSKFFSLPEERLEAADYVNFFVAHGGGSDRESGLEAIWEAIRKDDWKDGDTAIRTIVLWTDAPAREIGDTKEEYLYYNRYWDRLLRNQIGNFFVRLTPNRREDYMFDTFYPLDSPKSLEEVRSEFLKFHLENAHDHDEIVSMTVNIFNNCLDYSPCGGWDNVRQWPGVASNFSSDEASVADFYDKTLEQIVDMVESQQALKSIRIIR